MLPDQNLRPKRLYQDVAERITGLIRSGEFRVGDRLPPDHKLADRFGTSRLTIREGMVALEVAGIVEMRKGAGVYVVDDLMRSSGRIHLSQEAGPFEQIDARYLFESETAALAALTISEAELAELAETIDLMIEEHKNGFKSEEGDRRFHIGIARATRNSVIESVVEAMWNLRVAGPLWAYVHCVRMSARDARSPSVNEHQLILDALKAHDPHEARRAMKNHLTTVRGMMLQALDVEYT